MFNEVFSSLSSIHQGPGASILTLVSTAMNLISSKPNNWEVNYVYMSILQEAQSGGIVDLLSEI